MGRADRPGQPDEPGQPGEDNQQQDRHLSDRPGSSDQPDETDAPNNDGDVRRDVATWQSFDLPDDDIDAQIEADQQAAEEAAFAAELADLPEDTQARVFDSLDADEGVDQPQPMPVGALPDDISLSRVASVESATLPASRMPELTTTREGTSYAGGIEPADRPAELESTVDHPESFDLYTPQMRPNHYGDPLREGREQPVPLFDGPPTRDQTKQGELGDCGMIATLGAVAAHRPEAIANCVTEKGDGGYEVTLHETEPAWTTGVSEPTGRTTRLTTTPDLPVHDDEPDKPAFARFTGTAWVPVLEKAIAGVDQTWTVRRQGAWDAVIWPQIKALRDDPDNPLPDGPAPSGYARLNQGSTAWDRAELLTQLTGEPAEVRPVPAGMMAGWRLAHRWSQCLDENKPVLVGTRPLKDDEGRLPGGLVPSHAYEVTAVRDGRVHLRNPWNKWHPEPLTFREAHDCLGDRYTTLK